MKLRGSNKIKLEAVADTLERALQSAGDEKELRRYIKVIIKTCRKWGSGLDEKPNNGQNVQEGDASKAK